MVSTVSMATRNIPSLLLNLNEPFLRYLLVTISIVSRFHGNGAYIPGTFGDFLLVGITQHILGNGVTSFSV